MAIELEKINFTDYEEPSVSGATLNNMQEKIQSALNKAQEALTAGDNIKIENGVISTIGGGTQFLTQEISKSITAAGYATASSNMGALTIPEGYTFVGFLTKLAASGLVISYSLEDTTVKVSYHNGTNADIKTTVTAVAFFIKN